jgi:hypothetical protein
MRRIALLAGLLLGCAARPAPTPTPPSASAWAVVSAPAWTDLQSRIAGKWKADLGDGKFIRVNYRVISGGSAIVESFVGPSGGETLSVYHPDGAHLMLTHYCAQGNQARLKAVEVAPGRLLFRFLDATNVAPKQGVMRELSVTFDAAGFEQRSVYRDSDGKDGADVLKFVRDAE